MTNLNNKIDRTEEQVLFEKEIGRWLKRTRLSKTKIDPLTGRTIVVTQTKLARHLGVSFQQIQKYEKATNAVPIHNLIKIANYFDTSILEFLPAAELNQAVAKEESHSI